MLEARGISVAYDGVQVLWNASIRVERGEIVALMGPNGSGKSTLMNSISRLVPIIAGEVMLEGEPIHHLPPHRILSTGIAHVLERHRLFPEMTVIENLQLGAGPKAVTAAVERGLEEAFALFPRLKERRGQVASTLSGGEQQMCAIARGLMSRPRFLLVDEPFIGLSPQLRLDVAAALRRINEGGVSILLIEQSVAEALALSRRAYVLQAGRLALEGLSTDLAQGSRVQDVFMGRTLPEHA
ncbi:MAG: ABC transporter ATP-binding protein [Geminicoccales bacterium]